jgi:subtilisin family serine protease
MSYSFYLKPEVHMQKYKKLILVLLVPLVVVTLLYLKYNNEKNKLSANNSMYNKQWAIENKGQMIENSKGLKNNDINALKAWKLTTGSNNILVAILDTGIEIDNSEISRSIYTNENELPNNNIDDDKNGYIDDINGWNFYDNNNEIFNNYIYDYHGTYLTGIISSNHTTGIMCGVAPNIKILPLKFMRGSSGSINDAIKAIKYASNMGAIIINCSWDTQEYSESLKTIIKEHPNILFVCSAGKHRQDLSKVPVYPASYDLPNIITVGALNNQGQVYKYSGHGNDIDVMAPGDDILSILPENDFVYSEGTSVATAYVSGIAALTLSINPELELVELIKILTESKRNIKADYSCIDAYKCLLLAKKNIKENLN